MEATNLTAEQRAIRDTVRDFAVRDIQPHAAAWDRDSQFPTAVIAALGQLGVMGLPFPEQWGGSNAGTYAFCLVLEELARVDCSVAITIGASSSLAGVPLWRFGTDAQRATWLTGLTSGTILGAMANTEADAGSDASAISTTAVHDGKGWVLNGSKAYITNAGTPLTGFVLATARTPGAAAKSTVSMFIVPAGTPGLHISQGYRKLGWRASDTREVIFEDCRIGEDMLLGPQGAGLKQFLETLDAGRIGVAAISLGLARACLEASLEWSKQRMAFGKAIGGHQAVAFSLADVVTRVEAARGLLRRAAEMRDAGQRCTTAAAQAKLFASETAVAAADAAMQIHGGYSYIEESPIPRYYRDAKILTIGEGTSEILKLVIARGLGLPV